MKKKIKYIPSDDEIKKLLSQCDERQKLLVEFVRDTGCRISEALNLRRRDVLDGIVILYTRKSKDGNLMPREARFDTSKFSLPTGDDDRIFSHWVETPSLLSKKVNSRWNWHYLRHRYASMLSHDGIPIFEIMSRLGHSNIETTQKYLQLIP